MGGIPKIVVFFEGKSQSKMDDNVWGTPMTKRKPPGVSFLIGDFIMDRPCLREQPVAPESADAQPGFT